MEKQHIFASDEDRPRCNTLLHPVSKDRAFRLRLCFPVRVCIVNLLRVLKGKNHFKMTRFKNVPILVGALLLALSCLSKQEQALVDTATGLALKEEMTESSEAVVWLRGPTGQLSSHWIKNDVSGLIVVASRLDGVVPMGDALWRFPTEDTLNDYDWLELTDLVSGETLAFPLDEKVVSEDGNEPDSGVFDAGDGEPAAADEIDDETDDSACDIRGVQSLPVLLGGIGPYFFVQYNEKQYDCQDRLVLSEDRYLTLNLETKEIDTILTEAEIDTLMDSDEVNKLAQSGTVHYMGATPVYRGAVEPALSHVFVTVNTFVQEDGDRHAVVSSLEILGPTIPSALQPFTDVPELVLAMAVQYAIAIPAGWWMISNPDPNAIQKQLSAFLVTTD